MSSSSIDLSARCRLPELMDEPGLDPRRHRRALRALGRINALSRSAPALWAEIEGPARRKTGRFKLVDLACGGGDNAIALSRMARRRGLSVEVAGCDFSETALAHARAAAAEAGLPVEFFRWDLERDGVPKGFDGATCSLFLHHLDDEQGLELLRGMAGACELVVVQDLLRTRTGWWLSQLASRLVTRSSVVRVDAPLSVRAALSLEEVAGLAEAAGLRGARLRRIWPERFSLSWRKAS